MRLRRTTANVRGVVSQVRRAVFARHSHPLSAWSRLATMPLVLVPFWTRTWSHAVFIAVWFLVNPVMFGRPRSTRSFASRAMLGEEIWMTEKRRDAALAIDALASGLTVGAAVAAWKRRPVVAAVSISLSMAVILEYWRRVADIYDDSRTEKDEANISA
ncbi:DUF6653 family protein [Paramicrobacterium chengjingii]|uniref:DUF6653 family protein n=1 Tax=Paramicrobacterium chengjingii TaxID=2769067 RepID=UPI001AB05DC4|nr:DUF6653 family protein [Microbacterium chengjingii]